jgi:hypothetical protein
MCHPSNGGKPNGGLHLPFASPQWVPTPLICRDPTTPIKFSVKHQKRSGQLRGTTQPGHALERVRHRVSLEEGAPSLPRTDCGLGLVLYLAPSFSQDSGIEWAFYHPNHSPPGSPPLPFTNASRRSFATRVRPFLAPAIIPQALLHSPLLPLSHPKV